MRYGKLTAEGQVEYAPNIMRIRGGIVLNPQPEQLLEAGYLPVVDEVPEELPPEGKEWMPTGYTQEETRIVQGWELVDQPPPPEPEPRRFSKYKFADIMHQRGVYDQVMQMLDTLGVRWAWNDATVFKEDNGHFQSAVKYAKGMFNLTDKEIDETLRNCVSDFPHP